VVCVVCAVLVSWRITEISQKSALLPIYIVNVLMSCNELPFENLYRVCAVSVVLVSWRITEISQKSALLPIYIVNVLMSCNEVPFENLYRVCAVSVVLVSWWITEISQKSALLPIYVVNVFMRCLLRIYTVCVQCLWCWCPDESQRFLKSQLYRQFI